MILHLKLPTLKQNEHPKQYEDVEKFIDMGNWFVDEVGKKKRNFQFSIRNKIRYHRNISVPILGSALQEYVKAFCAPSMCYHNRVHLKCNGILNYKLSLKYYKSSPLLVPWLQHVGKHTPLSLLTP